MELLYWCLSFPGGLLTCPPEHLVLYLWGHLPSRAGKPLRLGNTSPYYCSSSAVPQVPRLPSSSHARTLKPIRASPSNPPNAALPQELKRAQLHQVPLPPGEARQKFHPGPAGLAAEGLSALLEPCPQRQISVTVSSPRTHRLLLVIFSELRRWHYSFLQALLLILKNVRLHLKRGSPDARAISILMKLFNLLNSSCLSYVLVSYWPTLKLVNGSVCAPALTLEDFFFLANPKQLHW